MKAMSRDVIYGDNNKSDDALRLSCAVLVLHLCGELVVHKLITFHIKSFMPLQSFFGFMGIAFGDISPKVGGDSFHTVLLR